MEEIKNNIHLIQNNDINVLYHIPSLQFFEISNDTYNRIEKSIQNKKPVDGRIQEIFDYLEQQEPAKERADGRDEEVRRLRKVVLLATQCCNLACRYCFASQGTYGEKEETKMSLETYKQALNYLLDKYPEGIQQIEFFGGEPLLGFRQIKEFLPYCIEEMKNRGIEKPVFGFITNGTVFTEEMIDFFNGYNIPITISVDGPGILNDTGRVSREGWSVYGKIVENLKWINPRRSFPLFFEVTLNKQHVLSYKPGMAREWMKELLSLGFDSGVVGVAEVDLPELRLTREDEDKYVMMYRETIDFWFEKIMSDKTFCTFDIFRALESLVMKKPRSVCGIGHKSLTINAKGDILPCYLFHGDENFRMGNVFDRNEKLFKSVESKMESYRDYYPEECNRCWTRNTCSVWCRGFSNSKYNNLSGICDSRCWTMKTMLEGVMVNLARLQRQPEKYKVFNRRVKEFNKRFSTI